MGSYGVLETQVGPDGNDLAGNREVSSAADRRVHGLILGRKDRFENGICNLQGGCVGFAATKAERLAAGDPRLSIEERYPSRETYLRPSKRQPPTSSRSASCCPTTLRCSWVGQKAKGSGARL